MNRTTRLLTALTAFLATAHGLTAQDETPIIPIGSLSAFPTIVQTGTHPQLTWEITIPEPVDDVIDIEPPGTLVPKRGLIMDVRVLGASVKRVWTRDGEVVDWEWVDTEARVKYNSGSYNRIFFDTNDNVNPNRIVHTQAVQKDSQVNFGARFVQSDGSWSTWYSTTSSSSSNVYALKDGDTPPTTTPMHQQPTIESFILPYLDEEGKITLGARDVIILMELTHTDPQDGGFDLQDMALLVTFYDEVVEDGVASDSTGETGDDGTMDGGGDTGGATTGNGNGNGNNGHGNNEDGVDMSNPGNSKSGEDTDPTTDDEKQRGRRKK